MSFNVTLGLAIILSCVASVSFANPDIAIIDLHGKSITSHDAEEITNRLTIAIQELERFEIIDQTRLVEILSEYKMKPESCKDRQCFQELGRLIDADALIIAQIEWPGTSPLFGVRIFDVHSGTIVKRGWLEGSSVQEIIHDIPRLVNQTFDQPLPTERNISPGFGVVLVDVSQDSTEIYLDNRSVGFTPVPGYIVKAGLHIVGVSRPGFIRESQTIHISAGDTSTVSFVLKPRPVTGILELSIPEPNAVVFIADEERGRSPETIVELNPGVYPVTIAKTGYIDWKKTYEIAAGDTIFQEVILKKVPMGYVRVDVSRDSIDVFLDNKFIGTSPTGILFIRSGIHTVGIRAEGFISESRTVEVFPGDTVTVEFKVTPRPTTGKIVLDINEDDASVYLDGEFAGRSPMESFELKPGEYSITVKKRDYLDTSLSIDVSAGKITQTRINLRKAPFGIIYIDVSHDGAEVFMDNKRIGISPVPGYRVSSGVHMVGVRRPGFFGESKRVELSPGDTAYVDFTLQPRPQARELLLEDEVIVK